MIADPWFYVAAVAAVLLVGVSKSGGLGFGALATPLMALTVPVPRAAAILLPVLLLVDMLGLASLVKQSDRRLLRLLLPAGLLGTVVGTALFGLLPVNRVAGVVGALTLAFLGMRLFFPPQADAPPPPRWLGLVLGTVSGFTSFVAHAGGPPISFYVLPLKLAPIVFTATMAVFFATVNVAKIGPYAWLGLLDGSNLRTSLVLLPFAPLGVWIGLRWVRRMSPVLFYRLFHAGMLLTGLKLVWDGVR